MSGRLFVYFGCLFCTPPEPCDKTVKFSGSRWGGSGSKVLLAPHGRPTNTYFFCVWVIFNLNVVSTLCTSFAPVSSQQRVERQLGLPLTRFGWFAFHRLVPVGPILTSLGPTFGEDLVAGWSRPLYFEPMHLHFDCLEMYV